jgi:RNA polymerase sigma-70 factor, ECF subfamily
MSDDKDWANTRRLEREGYGMGRHVAGQTAHGSPRPDRVMRAFDRMIAPHLEALRAYVWRLAEGNELIAEAILKETLQRVARESGGLPRGSSAVRPLLMLTARNVLRDRERSPVPLPHVPTATMVAAMRDLPAVHRELIVEVVHRGIALQVAAGDRGVSVESIKSRLYFAMEALRNTLERHLR